jgi:hypothetical protein
VVVRGLESSRTECRVFLGVSSLVLLVLLLLLLSSSLSSEQGGGGLCIQTRGKMVLWWRERSSHEQWHRDVHVVVRPDSSSNPWWKEEDDCVESYHRNHDAFPRRPLCSGNGWCLPVGGRHVRERQSRASLRPLCNELSLALDRLVQFLFLWRRLHPPHPPVGVAVPWPTGSTSWTL